MDIIDNKIIVSDDDICIVDSYKVSKFLFRKVLKGLKAEYPENSVMKNRKIWHMCLEWACHNFLYNINY